MEKERGCRDGEKVTKSREARENGKRETKRWGWGRTGRVEEVAVVRVGESGWEKGMEKERKRRKERKRDG